MAVFNFTVRATDSEGSYADRQFNITVRNSRVERFMAITTADAWTSPDATTWTQRVGAGGFTCAYGNGFWLIMKSTSTCDILKSTDGINYNAISTSEMTFLDPSGAVTTAPTAISFWSFLNKMKFWNGRFYLLHFANPSGQKKTLSLWSTADGVTWKQKILTQTSGTSTAMLTFAGAYGNSLMTEDGNTLFIPFSSSSGSASLLDVANGFTPCMGWSTTDGETFTPIRNSTTTTTAQGSTSITRFNGLYIANNTIYNGTTYGVNGTQYQYIYSTDGVNWTVGDYSLTSSGVNTSFRSSTQYYAWNPPIYANGQLFSFASKPSTVNSGLGLFYITSMDGLVWDRVDNIKTFNSSNCLTNVIYKNGVFFLSGSNTAGTDNTSSVGNSNNGFRVSIDGVNWDNNINITSGSPAYNDSAAM